MKSRAPSTGNIVVENFIVHYMLSFKHLCLVTVSCPLVALIVCFVTAYIFQPDDIHETHCKVSCLMIFLQFYLMSNSF